MVIFPNSLSSFMATPWDSSTNSQWPSEVNCHLSRIISGSQRDVPFLRLRLQNKHIILKANYIHEIAFHIGSLKVNECWLYPWNSHSYWMYIVIFKPTARKSKLHDLILWFLDLNKYSLEISRFAHPEFNGLKHLNPIPMSRDDLWQQ